MTFESYPWLRGKNLIKRFTKDGYSREASDGEVNIIKAKFRDRGHYKGIVEGLFIDDHKPPFDISDLTDQTKDFVLEKWVSDIKGKPYLVLYVGGGSWAIFRKRIKGEIL